MTYPLPAIYTADNSYSLQAQLSTANELLFFYRENCKVIAPQLVKAEDEFRAVV
jgi:hypothetical protein